jgi:transketolase
MTDSTINEVSHADVSTLEIRPSDTEDSDSWLEVSPDELDGLMMKVSGQAPKSNAEQAGDHQGQRQAELGEEHGKALGDLAKKVQEFVGGEGDIQGARFAEWVESRIVWMFQPLPLRCGALSSW